MFLLPLVPLPFWYIDMDVPFLFPSLPLATSASTAVILSKTHRGGERWEIERPLLQMTSVLYWSKARDTHNSTFVLWSTHAPMSSHSLLIVCVRVRGIPVSTAVLLHINSKKLHPCDWEELDFFLFFLFSFYFIRTFLDLNLFLQSLDWITVFLLRGYLLLSILGLIKKVSAFVPTRSSWECFPLVIWISLPARRPWK